MRARTREDKIEEGKARQGLKADERFYIPSHNECRCDVSPRLALYCCVSCTLTPVEVVSCLTACY
jgi:hypothetical protein